MAANSPVPVSVQGTSEYPGATAVIGDQYLQPPSAISNGFWYLVVDLNTLKVVVNEVSQDTSNVPASVQQYATNPQYLLIFVTLQLLSGSVPQGAVYTLLVDSGATYQLARMEQMIEQLGTGSFVWLSYIFAGQLGQKSGSNFEEFSFDDITVMTFQLVPITVGGQTTYIPAQIGT